MAEPAHILVVDDDDRLRALLKKYLEDQGYRVSAAADTREAERHMSAQSPDLMVLDVMMPGETGLEFMSRLRGSQRNIPVLMLSALGETEHRIHGLEAGVDDYLAKPFEPRELLLRLEMILRRAETRQSEPVRVKFGAFMFDLQQRKLFAGEEDVYLTSIEAGLLHALASHANRPVSREELARENFTGSDRSVDVQITRLRRKIEDDPKQPLYLQTVRHQGYVLKADEA